MLMNIDNNMTFYDLLITYVYIYSYTLGKYRLVYIAKITKRILYIALIFLNRYLTF